MTALDQAAADITAELDRRQELDDDALHEAFQKAAEHHENEGADRLRAWALETYTT